MLEVKTETGRTYLLDVEQGFWMRRSKVKGGYESWERLWQLKTGTDLSWPWQAPEGVWQDAELPEVGKHLFVSSKDTWYVSTLVVSVEEVEDASEPRI